MYYWKFNPANVVYIGADADKDFPVLQELDMKSIQFKNVDGLYFDKKEFNGHTVNNIVEMNDKIQAYLMPAQPLFKQYLKE